MSKHYILYHANCDDGFGAAWAAWLALGDTAEYIPVQYGQEPPEMDDDDAHVVIVDFSYPREVIKDKFWHYKSLTILDHHKTAEQELSPLIGMKLKEGLPSAPHLIRFDMDKSGAVMAWEHFHPHAEVPTLLKYVQDRDLWRNELPSSEEATAWRRSFKQDFLAWQQLNEIMETRSDIWTKEGAAILRANRIQIDKRVQQASEVSIGGYTVLAVNETQFFSEVAGELAAISPYEFGACFFIRGDGVKQWSLRSIGDFDVSEIAKQYGGGGHKNAAGFQGEV